METKARLTDINDIRRYVLGGEATVTLLSVKTGASFTYHVGLKRGSEDFFFVSLLTGPNNYTDFKSCGTVFWMRNTKRWSYALNARTYEWADAKSPSQAGMQWFINQLNKTEGDISEQVEVWTSGECAKCGRKLTRADSIAIGIGPTCLAAADARAKKAMTAALPL